MQKLLWVSMLLIGAVTQGQTCELIFSGVIEDQHDDSVLSQALISIIDTDYYTYSNEQGEFSIENLCPGNYTLEVAHAECKTRTFSIKINENISKVLKLEHHYEKLNEIFLKGNAQRINKSAPVDYLDLTLIAEKSDQSLGDLVSSLAGLSSMSTGKTIIKPAIHGLYGSRVTIVSNDVRLEDQQWGSEHAPNVDINLAQSVEVIKNASALQYSGDAIGGFIVLKPQRIPVKDTLYGKTRISGQTNGQGGSIHAGLIKSSESGWYGALDGTFKRYGDFSAPNYVLSNTAMASNSLAGRFGINKFNYGVELSYNRVFNNLGILRASHLGGAEDQYVALNSPKPLIINDFTYDIDRPMQEITHQIVSIKTFVKSNAFGRIDLRYDLQLNNRQEFDIRRGSDQNKASMDLDLETHAVSLDCAPQITGLNYLKTGLLGRFFSNVSNPNTGVKRLIPDYKRYDLGVYALAGKPLGEHLEVELGIRLDYMSIKAFKYYYLALWEERNYGIIYPEFELETLGTQILTRPRFDYLNPSASAGLNWSVNLQNELSLNFALGARNPNPSELFSEGLHHSASRIEIGDLKFESEISKNISLGFIHSGTNLSLSVNPFIRFIDRFILLEPTGIQQTIRGNFQVWSYRQTDVLLSGIDYNLRYALNSELNFDQQFSLVKGFESGDGAKPLINLPPPQIVNAITYKIDRLQNLEIRLESAYTWRQNEFPDTNFEAFIPETQTLELIDVSSPPGAYHLMNLEVGYPLLKLGNGLNKLTVRAENLLNTSYRNYLNSNRFYADEIGRNLLLSFTTTF